MQIWLRSVHKQVFFKQRLLSFFIFFSFGRQLVDLFCGCELKILPLKLILEAGSVSGSVFELIDWVDLNQLLG
jgi:hypothetical protein